MRPLPQNSLSWPFVVQLYYHSQGTINLFSVPHSFAFSRMSPKWNHKITKPSAWLLSFSMPFIPCCCINSSCRVTAEYSIMWMNHSLSFCWRAFELLPVSGGYEVATNISVQILVWTYMLGPKCMKVPVGLHSTKPVFGTVDFQNICHSNGCVVTFYCGFNLHVPKQHNFEHIFIW